MELQSKLMTPITGVKLLLYSIQHLDIDSINNLLDGTRTYQNYKKKVFIEKLAKAFEEFSASGDTFLRKTEGHCNGRDCNYKCKGFSFTGNKSGKYIDFVIETDSEGNVLDMCECMDFRCTGIPPFQKGIVTLNELPF